MTSAAVSVVRRSARAVLFDGDGRLVTIRRTKSGTAPYWTTPGGGIEDGDTSREAALRRELREELGADALVGPQVYLVSSPAEGGISVQHFFVARLIGIDEDFRTGEEYTDVSRGGYELDRIPVDRLDEFDLKPDSLRAFVLANASALQAEISLTS